jgi:hypothetical protein
MTDVKTMTKESATTFIERYQTKLIAAKMDDFVTVTLSSVHDGIVSLDKIKSHRLGKGYAKCALGMLLLLADECAYDIRLIPHPLDETTDEERLVKWYQALGFAFMEDGEVMQRRALRNGN